VIRYTKDHEWVRIDGDLAVCGITDHAQGQLGDVVFVEVPDPGRKVEQGRDAAVVESVKAASEVYAPISGTVAEANAAIVDDPSLVNRDAAGEGWFFKLRDFDRAQFDALMDEAAYRAYVAETA
jgi:glycine cleavage system H protein